MDDKAQELINDAKGEGMSDCCSATVYGDVCAECKEHCDIVTEEE